MQQSFSEKELKDFLAKALSRTYYSRHKNALAIQVLTETAETAGWDIDAILRSHMSDVKNEDIRQLFRRFLIAKKYNVRPPAIVYASDDCVLINMWNHVTSTKVLSPSGDVLIPEGNVILFPNTISYFGFVARDVATRKMGMYSKSGQEVLPCVFDNVTRKGELSYEGVSFDLVMADLAIEAISDEILYGRAIKFIYGNDQVAGISISYEQGTAEIIYPGVKRIILNPEQPDEGKVNSAFSRLRAIINKTHRIIDAEETNG